MTVQQGVPQRVVSTLDLPSLVIEPDQGQRRVAAVVGQGGDQPVPVPVAAAVSAGDGHVGLDDPHGQAVQVREVGAVRQMPQDAGMAGGAGAGQQHGPGGVDLGEEGVRVEGAVDQQEHAWAQQVQQPPGQVGLIPVSRRAEHSAEQPAGTGLGQGHQPQGGIPGEAHPEADPPDPRPVPVSAGNLQRVQPIEGDGAQPGEAHPRGARPGQRPGHHLKQRFHRRWPQAAPQVPQRLLRRGWHVQPRQPGGELGPDPCVAQPREHRQREQEIHPGPGRQGPQPSLHRLGLLQDIIDEFERQVPRQPAQVAWGIHPGGGCDGAGDRDGGRLNAQRDLWYLEDLGGST